MSQYTPLTSPDLSPHITTFFESFYRISDTPSGHTLYADQFTPDAKIIMGIKSASGRDEIIQMREGMWEKVAERSHHPKKIFSFGGKGGEGEEVMLYGDVGYVLKDGRRAVVEWGARAIFAKDEGEGLKLGFYQVYLDSAAVANAK